MTQRITPLRQNTCHGRWITMDFVEGLVSVIMPTYNRANMVTRSLDSVFHQSYRPIELIIVNDGSTDNTLEILDVWKTRHDHDPDFEVRIISQQNLNAAGARNHGLIESHGQFIQHFDDDDELGPEKINIQANWLKSHPEYDMVYGSTFGLGDLSKKPYQENKYMDHLSALKKNVRTHTFNTISPLYTRKAAYYIGPWCEQMVSGLDREYTARFLCTELKYQFLPEAEVFVRGYDIDYERASYHGQSQSDRKLGYYRSKLVSLEFLWSCLPAHLKRNDSLREIIAKEFLGISKALLLLREYALGKSGLSQSIETSRGTSCSILSRLLSMLVTLLGPFVGAKCFSLIQNSCGFAWRSLQSLQNRSKVIL